MVNDNMAEILKVRINGGWESIPAIQGKGVRTGGTTGQVLTKLSNADFDTAWATPPASPVQSVNGETGVVVLGASDVGALPLGYHDPIKTDLSDFNSHTSNSNNPHGVTKTQVGLSNVVNQPMDSTPTDNSLHYVTSGGVKTYVDTYGGKIDSITVNGESQALPISNKNVTIPKVTKNGVDITLANNAFDIIVPTKTSDLTNDSNFATLSDVSTSVSAEAALRTAADSALGNQINDEGTARINADTALGGRVDAEQLARADADAILGNGITSEATTRANADTALGTRITNETTARTNADTTLQGNITAEATTRAAADTALEEAIDSEAEARANADTTLQTNITAEATARSEADNLRVLISSIVNNTSTTTTNVPLSANMGKELQDQINNLKAIGRFLSLWDCTTGLPTTDPTVSPYTYKTGDYYIVSVVSSATPAVNYKPDGTTYTTGVPSTIRETNTVLVNDYYVFDGSVWRLVSNTQRIVRFENVAGDPYDNSNLAAALNNKVTKNNEITGATHSKITYDAKGLVTGGSDLALSDLGVTVTSTEINYLANASSNIQSQLNGKEETSNKTQSITSSSTTTEYPSAAAVYNIVSTHTPADMVGATDTTDGAHGLVPQPHAGDQNKYLQGNGAWTTVDALPSQAGQSGKYLTTNGTTARWDNVIVSNTAFGTIITNITDTQYTFTHNLNVQNVMVQVANSDYETIQVDVTRTSNNVVTIEFGETPTSAETYHVYCVAPTTSTQIVSGEEVSY